MALININKYYSLDVIGIEKSLKTINNKLNYLMANMQDLSAKVDSLQTALDTEQEQIAAAISALEQTVTNLQEMVTEGGTAEERQALADKIDSIKNDLQGTISDTPVVDNPPTDEPSPEEV